MKLRNVRPKQGKNEREKESERGISREEECDMERIESGIED
jgi:hypothetical protein